MTEITITFKVNTRTLTRQLNELDLSKMTPTDLEEYIKKNVEVCLIGSPDERRFYVGVKE